ncbi:hypothetical protein GQ457_17G023980 [Hibiscus cannabinus]
MPSRYSARIREEDDNLGNLRSIAGRCDVFLSEENARNIIHSTAADSGASREFIDTVIVPHIFLYALNGDCWPENLGRQVIKFRVEILVEMDPDDEIGYLVDESLANSVRFEPASESSIEALKRVHRVDEDKEDLSLKKKRKSGEGSSSGKGCTVCLHEFSDSVESYWMVRLEHVHYGGNKVTNSLAKFAISDNFEVFRFHNPVPEEHPDF